MIAPSESCGEGWTSDPKRDGLAPEEPPARLPPFSLNFAFDAVVMLTWSNWHTEPRSNRYHYATRFARHLPVFFVQPDIRAREAHADTDGSLVRAERLDGIDITIVHVSELYVEAQAHALNKFLTEQGIHRPLLWIYNVYFERFINIAKSRLRIFHATEDYVTPTDGLRVAGPEIVGQVRRLLRAVDLLIAVSEGVATAYRSHAGYRGRCIVLPNGCDYRFWRDCGAQDYVPSAGSGRRSVLFQGGINARLDYELLIALVRRLPDWEFWFCGDLHDKEAGWDRLSREPNVVHRGRLSVDRLAQAAQRSLVGIIPFKQDPLIQRSLPLKAYEYVACGLPVVSVPIDALEGKGDLFTIETTAEGFARSIERLAATRCDAEALAVRQAAARAQSYDCRFNEAMAVIGDAARCQNRSTSSLNLLMIYDDQSTFVKTIQEHLICFDKYSRHHYYYLPGTNLSAFASGTESDLDFKCFDAIVLHYSVRVSLSEHIAAPVAAAVARYRGPKLLFIQDEYENTEIARQWIERLGVDTVFTTIPIDQVTRIYPRDRFPSVDFVPTLTGYVPEDPDLDAYALPLADRPILLGYRGRRLPHHYGVLGHDKYRIGRDLRALCAERGISADIEVDDARRIYGRDWYRFVGSCRAMLGTESGSNVFDFDGSLKRLAEEHSTLSFEEFADRFLRDVPTPVNMCQISPKVFEAIRLRTALVLFEGDYSGVVQPGKHYISLKKDYSNVDAVFDAINDIDYLTELTERAYHEIIEQEAYSYREFVHVVDRYIDTRVGRNPRSVILSAPIAAISATGAAYPWPISTRQPTLVTRTVAESRASLDQEREAMAAALMATGRPQIDSRILRTAWRQLPPGFRTRLAGFAERRARAIRSSPINSIERRAARALARVLPPAARAIVRSWR